ncbi:hypothetical protein NQZ68_010337, partial [Dissostichus eleginoides]
MVKDVDRQAPYRAALGLSRPPPTHPQVHPGRPKFNQSLNCHLCYHPINKLWPSFNLTSIYMGRKAIAKHPQ